MTQPAREEYGDAPQPVAVIGMSCRFPGASGLEALWDLLCDGREAISDAPPDRHLGFDDPLDPRTGRDGTDGIRRGGFLDHIDRFDPYVFNISPREAAFIDPQQRLLLETAWEALEDAGQDMGRLAGSRTGVYIGLWAGDYEARMFRASRDVDLWMTAGGGRYAASGRLSFTFGFQGPSLTVDTACSSSLVAVILACQALRAGECEVALAGGANIILRPEITTAYSAGGALSPEGRCKFGDASADGYVRAEGVGVLILKPLSRALADGDRIAALIRGGAVTHNGQTGGSFMAPGEEAQARLLREAHASARVAAADIDYVEAHGTGNRLGDPAELRALGRVLSEGRHADAPPCLIGSVKTNIGHTESASGVAGLIKVILCLLHREVPPSLHFRRPNPEVPWDRLPLKMVTARTPLRPAGRGAVAAVSSFGITGTLAHVVVEEMPPPAASDVGGAGSAVPAAYVLPVSARNEGALRPLAEAYARRIESGDACLTDLCYSAGLRRTHHDWRLAVVGRSRTDLAAGLRAFARAEASARVSSGRRTPDRPTVVAFVFSGQGPHWPSTGMGLFESEPVFRDTLERLQALIRAETGWSLVGEMEDLGRSGRMARQEVVQPAVFAIQVALASLLQSWGIAPAAVVGHSVGEVAAAFVAGALDLEDAVRTICRRGRIIQRSAGCGRMAAVELTEVEARALLAPYGHRLAVAAINGPRSLTLSGEAGALLELGAVLEARGRFCRPLDLDHAFHSARMDPYLGEMEAAVREIRALPPGLPLYSTVRGELAHEGDYGPSYWPRNLRDTVRFADAIARMVDAGCNAFVELGPRPVLSPSLRQILEGRAGPYDVLATLRRDGDEPADLRGMAATLYTRGLELDWAGFAPRAGRYVPLPAYPWQRESFWIDETIGGESAAPVPPRSRHEGSPLAGRAPGPQSAPTVSLREALRATGAGLSRRRVMEHRLAEHLARVLRLPASHLDPRRRFKDMGLDSLTALELRNHVEAETGLKLPATVFWNYSTISGLATELAARMGVSLDADGDGDGDSHPRAAADGQRPADHEAELRRLLDELERLPEDEARRLLARELTTVGIR